MKPLSEDRLLWLACLHAESDREAFIDAWNNNEKEKCVREAKQFLKQIREYRIKRWGRTKLEAAIDASPSKSIHEIKQITKKGKQKS